MFCLGFEDGRRRRNQRFKWIFSNRVTENILMNSECFWSRGEGQLTGDEGQPNGGLLSV